MHQKMMRESDDLVPEKKYICGAVVGLLMVSAMFGAIFALFYNHHKAFQDIMIVSFVIGKLADRADKLMKQIDDNQE